MNDCDDPNDCTPENCPSDRMMGGSQPGIDQACCKSGLEIIPCFVGAISRTGGAVPPQPLWPDPGYPKIAEGGKIASAFCIPPTNSSIINTVYGVGGPGAFVLPVDTYVEFSP